MEEETEEDVIGAKFNAGMSKVYNISMIKKGCHDYKVSKSYEKWYNCMRSWRSEMNAKFSPEERERCDEYHLILEAYFNKMEDATYNLKGRAINISKLTIWNVDTILYDYELYLEDLEHKYKYGMPDADDDDGL